MPRIPSKIPKLRTLKVALVWYSPNLKCKFSTNIEVCVSLFVASFIVSLELAYIGELSVLTQAMEMNECVAFESMSNLNVVPWYSTRVCKIAYC